MSFAGLELFFVDAAGPGTSTRIPSVFFAFRSELDRDRAARAIAQQPSLGVSLPGGRDVASACGSILEVNSCRHSQVNIMNCCVIPANEP